MSESVRGRLNPDPQIRKFLDNRRMPFRRLVDLRRAMYDDDKTIVACIRSRIFDDYWKEPVTDLSDSARNKVKNLARIATAGHRDFPELVDGVYSVVASETSPLIHSADLPLVDALASRTYKAMLAIAFKLDQGNAPAPKQQALNRERAVEITRRPDYYIDPAFGDLSTVVNDVYAFLVPKTAEDLQQSLFAATRVDDWDAGLAAAFTDLPLKQI